MAFCDVCRETVPSVTADEWGEKDRCPACVQNEQEARWQAQQEDDLRRYHGGGMTTLDELQEQGRRVKRGLAS